jgi:hypothetical protein
VAVLMTAHIPDATPEMIDGLRPILDGIQDDFERVERPAIPACARAGNRMATVRRNA